MHEFGEFHKGMGIGGWLTNYKRFHVLPQEQRMLLTVGDMEHFREYITRRDVQNIAGMGLDHIRLGFDQIVLQDRATGQFRQEIWDLLDAFCEWCREAGLAVVLNLHKAVGNYCDVEEPVILFEDAGLQDGFVAFWEEMERHFAGRDELVFEILNEIKHIDPERANALLVRTVKAIRALNPRRRIILGGIDWNSAEGMTHLPILDSRVGYTWHSYAPSCFTHQRGVLQAPHLFYNRKMPWPGDIERYRDYERVVNGRHTSYEQYQRMDIQFLRDCYAPAFKFAADHPDAFVWLGEFGTIRHADIQWREHYMLDVISLCLEHNMPYCVWNYLSTPNDGNRFSLVDDDSRQILSQNLFRIIQGDVFLQ